MKKIVIIIFLLILITGCEYSKSATISTMPLTERVEYFYSDSPDIFNKIYEFEDGRSLLIGYKNIEYQNENEKYSLEEALEKRIITIDYFANKLMHYVGDKEENKLYSRLDSEGKSIENDILDKVAK